MRIVDRPFRRPLRCAVLPHIGQTHRSTQWIDTGAEMAGPDDHVYVSSVALDEMNRLCGNPTKGDYSLVKAQLKQALASLELVTVERDRLRDTFEHIDALESEGLRARRKPGRPKKSGRPDSQSQENEEVAHAG